MWKYILVLIVILLIILIILGRYLYYPYLPKLKKNKKYIVCVGDSITFGAGVMPIRLTASYPAILNRKLGRNYQVLNYGYSSRTLLKEGDFPYTNEKQFPVSHIKAASVIIIMLGTNDSKPFNWNEGKYEKQYMDFIKTYQESCPNARIYLGICPPAFEWHNGKVPYQIDKTVIKEKINPVIRKIANQCSVGTIDFYSLMKNNSKWFADGIHPLKKGNQMMAEEVYKCLKDDCLI